MAGLSPDALAQLAQQLGGEITGTLRPLPGGLDAAMDALNLRLEDGHVQRLVLRRYAPDTIARDPDVAARCWRTLAALADLGLAAPRAVWFDPSGSLFGAPALVMSRLSGRSRLDSAGQPNWIEELAAALNRIHSAPLEGVDLSFLRSHTSPMRSILSDRGARQARVRGHPDGAAVAALLDRHRDRLQPAQIRLVHGDYWAGNTVWRGRRVTGVVDWDSAALDDPALDVAYCRMDLAMLAGEATPDLCLAAYERLAAAKLENLALWDLLAAFRAMPDPGRWLPGYHGLGRTDITAGDMRSRLRAFVSGAMERLKSESIS